MSGEEAPSPYLCVRLNPSAGDLLDRTRALPLLGWLNSRFHASVSPIFPAVDLNQAELFPGHRKALLRLLDWHRIYLYEVEASNILYDQLQRLPNLIRDVHRVPRSPGPPSPLVQGPLSQAFREPSPRGVGADRVHGQKLGALGKNVRLADIEHGWGLDSGFLTHADLPTYPVLYGGQANAPAFADHGTRVLGILAAQHQNPPQGVRGLAPEGRPLLLLGNLKPGPDGHDIQTTDTQLGNAINDLVPGDIVLVEAQTWKREGGTLLPAEVDRPVFDAIRACVTKGITVVAAAGNGHHILEPMADSGSILVAGGGWEEETRSWRRAVGSNHGAAIHCFAEGEDVPTTALDPAAPGKSTTLTTSFSGTSAASAIVAGVAASVQGMARAAHGKVLSPGAMRQLLTRRDLATLPGGENEGDRPRIGVMPDLERLSRVIDTLGPGSFL